MKKPVTIQAIQYRGNNIEEVYIFASKGISLKLEDLVPNEPLFIQTIEGTMRAKVGDFIIKGIKGEFYPCNPEIFRLTYEEIV